MKKINFPPPSPAMNRAFRGGPPPIAVERFGRVLQPGDDILIETPISLSLRVAKIEPCLDPRVPPGHVVVTLTRVLQMTIPAAQPVEHLVRVVTYEENLAQGKVSAPEKKEEEDSPASPTGPGDEFSISPATDASASAPADGGGIVLTDSPADPPSPPAPPVAGAPIEPAE